MTGPEVQPLWSQTREAVQWRPWTSTDLIRVILGNALGLLLVAIAWDQASGQVTVRQELTWFELGVAGLGVAGVANGLWLLSGRRHVGMARVAVLGGRPGPHRRRPTQIGQGRPVAVRNAGDVLVSGPGMTLFHRADCLLVAGKVVHASDAATHEAAGRSPCEVCSP